MNKPFFVEVVNQGETWFLRGTIWTSQVERRNQFETKEAAKAAIENAKKFMTSKFYKNCQIMEMLQETKI